MIPWQHAFIMRTTVTLDPDVAKLAREIAEHKRISFKVVVNDALRRGLRAGESRAGFRVVPHPSALQRGIDVRGFNELAGELEDESVLSKSPRKTS
jgi:hypothetical protein